MPKCLAHPAFNPSGFRVRVLKDSARYLGSRVSQKPCRSKSVGVSHLARTSANHTLVHAAVSLKSADQHSACALTCNSLTQRRTRNTGCRVHARACLRSPLRTPMHTLEQVINKAVCEFCDVHVGTELKVMPWPIMAYPISSKECHFLKNCHILRARACTLVRIHACVRARMRAAIDSQDTHLPCILVDTSVIMTLLPRRHARTPVFVLTL